ncbi:AVPR1A [Lepeophtheirus salmonis]|uniref:AVPR1A n=1 Tax=Lepeophtheirus salmonis TaxID=72036 RepID=A0A7R8D0K4_LEPSM|nr:AVPR1A [Lepeophtheirus salmonis]CAF2959688.1 AVPR1A [Lepeophtheirus salmonis]
MTRMYFFILHLSIADVLTAFLTLLPELIWTYTSPNFYGGAFLCKAVKFGQMIGPYLSSYVLIMTAIDRYHAICFPFSKCTWTPKRSNIMIGLAWLVSLALCVPQIIIFGSGEKSHSCSATFAQDWGQKAYVTWFAVSNFFLPLIILIYCYGCICKCIWDNFNSKIPLNPGVEVRSITCCKNKGRAEEGTIRYRWKSTKRALGSTAEYSKRNDTIEEVVMNNLTLSVSNDNQDNPNQIQAASSFTFDRCGKLRKSKNKVLIDLDSPTQTKNKKSLKPRTHSIQGISRAKIKTIKLTVVVIAGYIACSAPFICVQLWVTFGTVTESIRK